MVNTRLDKNDWKSEAMHQFQGQQTNKAPRGTRSKAIDQQILKAAEEVLQQTAMKDNTQAQYWQSEAAAMTTNLPVKHAKPRDPVDRSDSYLTHIPLTTYYDGTNVRGGSGLTMASTDCPMKKNTNFSTPMGEFKKAPTHMY
jgi:hypothetical protein